MGGVADSLDFRIKEDDESIIVTVDGRCSKSGVALMSFLVDGLYEREKEIVLDLLNMRCRRCCRGSVDWFSKLPETVQTATVVAARKGMRCLGAEVWSQPLLRTPKET